VIPDTYGHWYRAEPYTAALRAWLGMTDHYLGNPPPGAMFAVAVRLVTPGLFGPEPGGELVGLVVVGRPIAPGLPQDGTTGQILRMWLAPGLPHGTASEVLRFTAWVAAGRGVESLITYHDRTRHTGCAYRKAGFRKDGVTHPGALGWGSRDGRVSGGLAPTPKRRWRFDLRRAS
jgi:hypothetical protein